MHSHQSTCAEGRSNRQPMATARRRSSRLHGAKPVSYHDASGSGDLDCDDDGEEEDEEEEVEDGWAEERDAVANMATDRSSAAEKPWQCNLCTKQFDSAATWPDMPGCTHTRVPARRDAAMGGR